MIFKKRWYTITGVTERQLKEWGDQIDDRFDIVRRRNGEIRLMIRLNIFEAAKLWLQIKHYNLKNDYKYYFKAW